MKAKVIDIDSNPVGEIELADEVFGLEPRKDILARMVNYQLAKRRAGTHRAKERSDVEGSTRKIWKQKGTGRARHGGIRAPQFRGGGKVFGPVVRSHAHDLPKKVRRLALKHALSAKVKEAKLVVLADTQIAEAKTAGLLKRLQKLGWANALIIDGATVNQNFQRAAANIPNIDVLPTQGCNVYDILRRDVLVLTKGAAEALQARLK